MTKRERIATIFKRLQRFPLLAFCLYVAKNFQADGCLRSAAALTYLSLFAVVPLLTVAFAMLSAIPAFASAGQQIQQLIFTHFLPSSGSEVQRYLMNFSRQARNLTGIGIAFLAVTSIAMLMNIEREFNLIWRARRHRSGLSSFLRYWAILSLGPLCIGLAIGMSTYLASLQFLFDQLDIFGMRKAALVIAPYVLTSIAFTLLFAIIPNTRVALRDAAIGGVTSAFFFEIAKYIFASAIATASYEIIYGTFAAIPLFLLWIHTSWIIVLAGAETAHAIATYGRRSSNLPPLTAALGILETLWRRYARGDVLREREILQRNFLFGQRTLAAEQWTALRDILLKAGLIRAGLGGELILARNLQNFTLGELCERFAEAPLLRAEPACALPAWLRQTHQLLIHLRDQQRAQLQTPLAELFERGIATANADTDETENEKTDVRITWKKN